MSSCGVFPLGLLFAQFFPMDFFSLGLSFNARGLCAAPATCRQDLLLIPSAADSCASVLSYLPKRTDQHLPTMATTSSCHRDEERMDTQFSETTEDQSLQQLWHCNERIPECVLDGILRSEHFYPTDLRSDTDGGGDHPVKADRIWYKLPENGYEFECSESDMSSSSSSSEEDLTSEEEESALGSDADDSLRMESRESSSYQWNDRVCSPTSSTRDSGVDSDSMDQIPSTVLDLIYSRSPEH